MVIQTDALIIGAGPCGLFQVFELGLLGVKADIIDTLQTPGGQCTWLYPDKPIYDIPAVPVCTGAELVASLMKQIEPFGATFHLGEEVVALQPSDGGFRVRTAPGKEFQAKTIFIAGGVGSFQPRKLHVDGAESLEERFVHYHVRDPAQFKGKRLAILGGGDSALDWALALGPDAAALTLIHRKDEYRAAPASVAQLKARAASGAAEMIELANATGLRLDGDELTAIDVSLKDGTSRTVAVDHVLVFFGLSPKLGPIAEWGLNIHKKAITVDTAAFQSNIPGIFAIGDICDYPGKKKLILSGFHEAALAAFAAKALIEPGKKVHLQYTTTSPLMQKRLGVTGE
ncbi:MAG: NAD(P)/FAD-dependent oxidoreductase [Chromatiales bacterium]|jgi:thioredoxin reductase (NADPH)|nr:MAG: NAD(P)/FAD-dependent oxidoreductase [Chromatiales bacterium]